jgi:rod shape-determining protein MreD
MIMRPGQQLLLPANPFFIWTSLIAAMLLNMMQNMGLLGRAAWTPDILAVVLVFWTVHQPLRINIGSAAFVFGLLMDVHQGGLLGQHAMAYTVLSFAAITIHRRLLWFSVPLQAAQVFPLFFALAHAVALAVRMLAVGRTFPGILMLLGPRWWKPILWPVANIILLAPQLRAPNPDANRPLII